MQGSCSLALAGLMITAACSSDEPEDLKGLGQTCVAAMRGADCPANAKGCLVFSATATTGICSTRCVTGGTITTDAQGRPFISPDPFAAPQQTKCADVFSAPTGIAECNSIIAYQPMDLPLLPNAMYTNVDVACLITCGPGVACPGLLHCSETNNLCVPD